MHESSLTFRGGAFSAALHSLNFFPAVLARALDPFRSRSELRTRFIWHLLIFSASGERFIGRRSEEYVNFETDQLLS